jgi:hypothetical protein
MRRGWHTAGIRWLYTKTTLPSTAKQRARASRGTCEGLDTCSWRLPMNTIHLLVCPTENYRVLDLRLNLCTASAKKIWCHVGGM